MSHKFDDLAAAARNDPKRAANIERHRAAIETETEAMKGIRRAAKRRARAVQARKDATDDLRRHCHAAQDAGVSISQIAREARLSRQGVYDLLGAQRPSRQS